MYSVLSLVAASSLLVAVNAQQNYSCDTPLAAKRYDYESVPYQVDTCDGDRGRQVGYNQCNSTTAGPTSLCQTAIVNSIDVSSGGIDESAATARRSSSLLALSFGAGELHHRACLCAALALQTLPAQAHRHRARRVPFADLELSFRSTFKQDFCLWGPQEPGEVVGNIEGEHSRVEFFFRG